MSVSSAMARSVYPAPSAQALVVIDLQRVVGPEGPWEIVGVPAILERVAALLRTFGPGSVLTRHRLAPQGPGRWATFAARWHELDADPRYWELMDEVAAAVPRGAAVVDKHTYSAFPSSALTERLVGAQPELVIAGCETDCCVVATMFAAVDCGIGVALVADALVGPSADGHRAILEAAERLPEQVRIVHTEELILSRHPEPAKSQPRVSDP